MIEIFNILLVNPTINGLLFFFYIFTSLNIPGAFGFSVVALTALVRILFNPFYAKQMNMAKQMEEIKPELDKLTKKYKNDKEKLQKAQLKLYQDRGVNPASGCLVAILQIPIFIALYQVLRMFLLDGHIETVSKVANKVVYSDFLKISTIDPWFLGFNLGVAPSQFKEFGFYYLIIPLITAGLQFAQISLQTPAMSPSAGGSDSKKGGAPDFQQTMSKQMKFMFPIMIAYFSYILPVGLALYWNIFSLFSILQAKKKQNGKE